MNIKFACYNGCSLKGSLHRTETNVGFVFLCAGCFHLTVWGTANATKPA